jgi:hypothetical protein
MARGRAALAVAAIAALLVAVSAEEAIKIQQCDRKVGSGWRAMVLPVRPGASH